MNSKTDNLVEINRDQRRRFLRLFGTAAAMLPVTVIIGCSDDQPSMPASRPSDKSRSSDPDSMSREEMESSRGQAGDDAEQSTADASEQASADMEKLSLDDPNAKSLGYKHDAANVDLQKYPQRGKPEAANHYCKNCALFQSREGSEWGPCTIFPNKLVHANGWCSAYVPRPS